jgi:threonine dehydrogenase-like Zn-dependent dehydrogenase
MRAGVYSGIGKIECREVKKPVIGANEVLVKVRAASVCGTDLKIFRSGYFKLKEGTERILGHEITGDITEVGSAVTGYREGMKVGIAPNIGCGRCRYCRMGKTHLCPDYDAFGISIDGGFAEYVKVHEKAVQLGNLVPFSGGVPYEEAVLAEPLACCYNAYNSVGTRPGDTVRLAGSVKVMVADLLPSRLELIQQFGPDILINTSEEDLEEAVMRHTGGWGADVIITACPVPEIQEISVRLASKLGRINLFGGLPKGKEHVKLNTNLIHYNGILLTGTTGASLAEYELSLNLICEKKIDVKNIVSKLFGIEDIKEAFDYALSGKGLKSVVVFPD